MGYPSPTAIARQAQVGVYRKSPFGPVNSDDGDHSLRRSSGTKILDCGALRCALAEPCPSGYMTPYKWEILFQRSP